MMVHHTMLPDPGDNTWERFWRRALFLFLCALAFTPFLVTCMISAPFAKGADPIPMTTKTDTAMYREKLTPEQFHVCFEHGTEPAFTGKYWNTHTPGTYHCVACGATLFRSSDKFESGTGWPSFTQPAEAGNVAYTKDHSMFMTRTEVHCAHCGAHLGHVFDDGPKPTGKRFCINSAALKLVPDDSTSAEK